MTEWPGIRRIFRLDRGDVERSVDDELRFHFERAMKALERRGLDPAAAQAEAERMFGDVAATRARLSAIGQSRVRRQRRSEGTGNLLQDFRIVVRGLRLRPWFTLAIVVTLGLGIGANVTMFGVVDRLLFRPPPFLTRPGEVNRVYLTSTQNGVRETASETAYLRYADLTRWTTTLSQTAAVYDDRRVIGTGDAAQELPIEEVSASFWSFFTARPALGRFFTAEEDRPPAGTAVAVLGYSYWQTAFGGDRAVIGRALHIGRQNYTIIGVAPRGFLGTSIEVPAVFVPITAAAVELGSFQELGTDQDAYSKDYGWTWLSVLVRRKAGITYAAASADLTNAYFRSYEAQRILQPEMPRAEMAQPQAIVAPVQAERGPNRSADARVATWLIAVAAIVLIIACANVGNLLIARALGRRREIAVRLALGISRPRLLGQVLAESLVLSALGGAFGLGLAHWGGAIIRQSLLPNLAGEATPADLRLIAFTLAATLVAGIAAAIVPALQMTRIDLTTALKTGVREGGHARSGIRGGLLITQATLSLVLLVGAALFVQSLRRAERVRLGYDPDRVLSVQVRSPSTSLSRAEAEARGWQLVAAARALPEVEAATRSVSIPFQLSFSEDLFVTGTDSVTKLKSIQQQSVTGEYFRVMGTAILRGQPITDAHSTDSSRVIVVSQSLAKILWPHTDALGQCIRLRADSMPCTTVIGIAADIKTSSLGPKGDLLFYLPITQNVPSGGFFIRTRGPAAARAEAVRRALQRIVSGTVFIKVQPFTQIMQRQTRSWRLGATMFTVFGALALLVAAVGLYSVVAYGVTQRGHEMAIRVALGAQGRNVIALVLGEVLRTTMLAVAIGIAIALVAAPWIAPLLFEVSPRDPVLLSGVAGLLLAVAALAGALPAWRAAHADPNAALRAD